jgi:uncharacterized protein YecE (DUF72 family)
LCLGQKMGPILWQFPPFVTLKDDRFEKFIKLLPHTSKEMATLAKEHGKKVKGRAFTEALAPYKVRHAFEFRHKSFNNPDFLKFLKSHNIAAVMHHASDKSAGIEELTADFAYIRLHGQGSAFKKGYSAAEIKKCAAQIKKWQKKSVDIFAYFGTEAKEYAPFDALKLGRELGLKKELKRAA